MLAPLQSAIDRGEHEQYLFLPLYVDMENSLVTMHTLESIIHSERVVSRCLFLELGRWCKTSERVITFHFQSCLKLIERFK